MLSALSGLSVLVVEDDPTLRNLYRTVLIEAGYTVIAVSDGVAALHTLETQTPGAIILDLALPGLHGRDVHREIRANPASRDIPIVVVTGTDTSDLRQADFACILKKPLDPDALLDAVRNCVRRRR